MRIGIALILLFIPTLAWSSLWDDEILIFDDGIVKVEVQYKLRDNSCETLGRGGCFILCKM